MKIRQLEINRFRGIKSLSWKIDGDFVCLVGPGDSTKTTILDAVELTLTPRWNVQFDDTDFYDADVAVPFSITATVGDLPEQLKSDAKYGLYARGWAADGNLHDEPEDNDELVLSVRLTVDATLEPSWVVITDRDPEGKHITARDRESLGCGRLGDFLARHFTWGRGSVLSRLTGEADGLAQILADAGRAARAVLADAPPERFPKLNAATDTVARIGTNIGVAAKTGYRAQLDVDAASPGASGLSLHDGQIPLRRAGLGTRRLLAVAMQREAAKVGGITLIDEVEYGLEPHRLRRLLRILRDTADHGGRAQILMTTHAPVVLHELSAPELRVVRSEDGYTSVRKVDTSLQPIILRATEAFVGRKVIVCEGKTELGICRRLDEWWAEGGLSFGLAGVAIADGGGEQAPSVAKALCDLGYSTALLADSDRPLNPDRPTLESRGVVVFCWEDNFAIEERIVQDLPWDGVAELVCLAMDQWGRESVRDAVADKAGMSPNDLGGDPTAWLESAELRGAVGKAAKEHSVGKPKRKGWFKRVDLAE
jgi:energy-coupling factor transporter ATP-binding protein EcfA2